MTWQHYLGMLCNAKFIQLVSSKKVVLRDYLRPGQKIFGKKPGQSVAYCPPVKLCCHWLTVVKPFLIGLKDFFYFLVLVRYSFQFPVSNLCELHLLIYLFICVSFVPSPFSLFGLFVASSNNRII